MNIFGNQTTFVLKTSSFLLPKIAQGDFDPIFAKNIKILEVCQISVSYGARRKAVY